MWKNGWEIWMLTDLRRKIWAKNCEGASEERMTTIRSKDGSLADLSEERM